MECKKFVCCNSNPQFENIKNGYMCMNCGKKFLNCSIEYDGKSIVFENSKYQTKTKGRKSDFLRNTNIFSTLETGKVNIMNIDNNYNIVGSKSIKTKKNILEQKLNFNNSFLTISEKGIIDVYDIESEETIGCYKTGSEYSHYKIKIYPFNTEGKWLYIDTEKIILCSSDFEERNIILKFKDVYNNDILSIQSVDHNSQYDSFAIHVNYLMKNMNNRHDIIQSSIVLRYNNENFEIVYYDNDEGYNLSYDFKNNSFYGVDRDNLVIIGQDEGEKYKLPIIKSYSDGEGLFWLEEFVRYPEKVYFLNDYILVLLYIQEIIVLNVNNNKIINSFNVGNNLIQSFFIIDENAICYSAGLNTFIIKIKI